MRLPGSSSGRLRPPPINIKNNESDMMVAFRKEGGTWKFWNQALLEFKYLKP